MTEAFHVFGQDLVLGANGDLLLVSGVNETNQRIIRRLCTVSGNYLWNLTYGAGLPLQVGLKANAAVIAALVRGQIFQEATVASTPLPTVTTSVNAAGVVVCTITYTYASTSQTVSLSIPLTQ